MFAGATVVLYPGLFMPAAVASLLVTHGVSLTVMIPVLYGLLSKQNLQGHKLRVSLSGADRLTETVSNSWLNACGVRINNIYGSTEIAGCVTYNSGSAPPHSIGQVITGHEIDIREGQLWIKAPTAGLCYWHDKHWSERQFGEWMPTGDCVEQDQQGNLYFLGRMNDVIKVNGNFVDLGAIEQKIMGLPGVQESVVVGQLLNDGHARLKAFVVPVPGQTVEPAGVHRYVKELEFVDSMPRTENGKIQRYKLRNQM